MSITSAATFESCHAGLCPHSEGTQSCRAMRKQTGDRAFCWERGKAAVRGEANEDIGVDPFAFDEGEPGDDELLAIAPTPESPPEPAPEERRSHRGRKIEWSRDRIIRALRAATEQLGDPPSFEEWRVRDPEGKRPASPTVVSRFGTWNAALEAAGLPLRQKGGARGLRNGRAADWPTDEILAALRTFGEKHGRAPTALEWKSSGDDPPHPSAKTIGERFGSWADAVEQAGFDRPTRGRRVSEAEKQIPVVWAVKVPEAGLRYRTTDEALIAAEEVEHDGERVAENARRSGNDARADEAIDRSRELARKIRAAAGVEDEPETETVPDPGQWDTNVVVSLTPAEMENQRLRDEVAWLRALVEKLVAK